MVGGLLWGCSLFSSAFFFGFFVFFGKVVSVSLVFSRLFGLAIRFLAMGNSAFLASTTLVLGRDHFDLTSRSCFNLSILVVLVILSWLFQHVTVVLGFCGNGCPGFGRGYCGFADVDSGRPHRAYDGGSLFSLQAGLPRLVSSGYFDLILDFATWAPCSCLLGFFLRT